MLRLVLRRALVQRRLLASVVVLVTTAACLVGVCSLLLGVTKDRAFAVEIGRAEPDDLSVTAYLVELPGPDVAAARAEAEGVVREVLSPTRPTLTSTATSRMRRLDDDRLAYLMTSTDLAGRAALTSGRWPSGTAAGPPEAVVPDTTARLLGLRLGQPLVLGEEVDLGGVEEPVRVVVVGTFRPQDRAGWEGDPLSGAGYSPAYSDGAPAAPAYGPFAVADASFLASGSSVKGLRVTARPTPALADDPALRAAVDALDDASAVLASRVDDRARITRVASELPGTLSRVHAQEASTRATVLVVLLLGTALSLAAALLAGWLVASVRDGERTLLLGWGLSRRQQLGSALLEALLLAAVSAALAVPAAALVHSRLTHLLDLRTAGLSQPPTVTSGLVLTVVAAAVLLAVALAATGLDAGTASRASGRRGAVARLGLDLSLLAVAALAWWQLRSRPATVGSADDVVLTLAPVLCVGALTVVAVRLVPLLLARAATAGTRSRSLVLPLAVQQAARRSHAGTAMVLVAAAVAAAVFGLGLRTTWERSQHDQAALRIGTDLALTLPAAAELPEAAEVAGAVDGGPPASAVSAVVRRPLVLGRYVGEEGSRPVLVGVDTRQAGALLRGRTGPGTSWAEVGAGLAPGAPLVGLTLPDEGAGVRLQGSGPAGTALTVVPTAVVQDRHGFRSSVPAARLPLDGEPHPVRWQSPVGPGLHLIGLSLEVDGPGLEPSAGAALDAAVEVVVSVPGPQEAPADGPAWQAGSPQRDTPVSGAAVAVEPTADETLVRTTFGLDLVTFAYSGAVVLATAFAPPAEVPVAVSQELVDAVGAGVGEEVSAIVGDTALVLRVAAVVPTVPSAPGQVAVLADADTLTRALIDAGRLDPVVDAWWVGRPAPGTEQALRALDLGEVTERQDLADHLAQGPLRVTVPTALLALVAVAVAMLLAGVALVLSGEGQRRSAEVVRLRALGLSRRDARRLLLAEHTAFFLPLLLAGALVGAAAAAWVGPHLVRSDLGTAPVPHAVLAWPWRAELLLVGGLLLGALAVTAVVTALHVRRSDPAHLRTGEG